MEHLRDKLVEFLRNNREMLNCASFSAQEVLRLADKIIEIVEKEGIK